MADLTQIEMLAGKMEWFALAVNASSDRSLASIMMSNAAASLCIALATIVMSWILIDRSMRFSIVHSGAPRLGFAGCSGLVFLFLALAPASDMSAWLALFGHYEQHLALTVLDAAIPSVAMEKSFLGDEIRTSFEAAAAGMVTGLASRDLAYDLMTFGVGVFALHSVLIRGNAFIRRGSPLGTFAGGCMVFFAIASITRPELRQALPGDPEAYLKSYFSWF